MTSPQRMMTQRRKRSADSNANVRKQVGVQDRAPELFSIRPLGIPSGWDAPYNRS